MSAPNLREIEWAISELENQESSEGRYTFLAALYTCRNQMQQGIQTETAAASYSGSAAPAREPLDQYGSSDFLQAAAGKDYAEVMAVMDELMDTLRVVNARAYDNVMRKLERL